MNFKSTGLVEASGSIMSLVNSNNNYENIPNIGCFFRLFMSCTTLKSAPELPAKNLNECSYSAIFQGCTSLIKAPSQLPATVLKPYSYSFMFYECSSLTKAPDLLAPIVPSNAYKNMFTNCSNLNTLKCLATLKVGTNSFINWLVGVSSTGTFIINDEGAKSFWNSLDATEKYPAGWTVIVQ